MISFSKEECSEIINLSNTFEARHSSTLFRREDFHKSTSDFVSLIQVTSNWEEGVGEKEDFHPGPNGCYTIYKKLHELLKVYEPIVDFEIDASEKDFL